MWRERRSRRRQKDGRKRCENGLNGRIITAGMQRELFCSATTQTCAPPSAPPASQRGIVANPRAGWPAGGLTPRLLRYSLCKRQRSRTADFTAASIGLDRKLERRMPKEVETPSPLISPPVPPEWLLPRAPGSSWTLLRLNALPQTL